MAAHFENILFVIPARGGSKGIPGKNIKELAGKILIHYSIELARHFVSDEHICVSTDDKKIIEAVESINLKVPFVRPDHLATDSAGSYEVLLHAVEYYKSKGINYEIMVLLQPTSPFRRREQVKDALLQYTAQIDMVVSVEKSYWNPYYNLFEEDSNGYLKLSKSSSIRRRQDCPDVYSYNGAIYIVNIKSLMMNPLYKFEKVKKFEMDRLSSIDLDSPIDWEWAEYLLNTNRIKFT